MKGLRPVSAAAAVGAAVLLLASCYPGDAPTVSETDVVVTRYANDVNWGSFLTYAIPDTVVHIYDPDNPPDNIDKTYDQLILDTVRSNLAAYGYTRQTDAEAADLLVAVSVASTTNYLWWSGGGYCYWWGWYYPCWGYYPPYWGVSSYVTGTVFIDLIDPDIPEPPDPGPEDSPIIWDGLLNGVASTNTNTNRNRIESAIDQAFTQSPYLRVHTEEAP